MSICDFGAWESELLEAGRIVQDNDASAPPAEAEQRFNRYRAMVYGLNGSEGSRVAFALVRSIQAVHDYGAYEAPINLLLHSFPAEQSAAAIVNGLPRLVTELPDWAGDLLSSLTRAGEASEALIPAFNHALAAAMETDRALIDEFIRDQEADGCWLEDRKGVLGSSPLGGGACREP